MPPRAVPLAAPRSFAGAPLVAGGALLWLAMSIGACANGAAPQPPAAVPAEWRLLVRLSAAFDATRPDAATIAAQASRSAGVPAAYVAGSGAGWHALVLRCAPADCDAAQRGMAADRLHFDSVERDALRRAAR